jgi:aconitate hydratase
MGVLPLEFLPGEGRTLLGLTGDETYDIEGLTRGIKPRMNVTVRAWSDGGSEITFEAVVRVDSPLEAEQYRHGGILPMIVRRLVAAR